MAQDLTINVWKYSRWVYVIGRSVKFRAFSTSEREAVVTFLNGMLALRPGIKARFNIKRGNAYDFTTELVKQNDYTLGKMLQVIGRDMKAKFPVTGEKALCDALFSVTAGRKDLKYKISRYTIAVNVTPAGGGLVTGAGEYNEGTSAVLAATAERGYLFSKWDNDSTNRHRDIVVTGDATYTATFTADTARTITATGTGGTVTITPVGSFTAPYYDGDKLTLTPVPSAGYHFVKWEDNNSTTAERQVTVSGDKDYIVVFEADVP